mgnify:CR=1 FL=1
MKDQGLCRQRCCAYLCEVLWETVVMMVSEDAVGEG